MQTLFMRCCTPVNLIHKRQGAHLELGWPPKSTLSTKSAAAKTPLTRHAPTEQLLLLLLLLWPPICMLRAVGGGVVCVGAPKP